MNRGLEPITPPEPTTDRTPPAISEHWHTFQVRFWPLFGIGSVAISAACLIVFARFLVYPSPYPKIYIVGLSIAEGMVLAVFTATVDYLMHRTGVNSIAAPYANGLSKCMKCPVDFGETMTFKGGVKLVL
jgi:hypothetical protein